MFLHCALRGSSISDTTGAPPEQIDGKKGKSNADATSGFDHRTGDIPDYRGSDGEGPQ